MAWTSPDLTPMDFLLWGFVKDSVYVPPLQTILHELKTRIREACAKIDHEILRNMWLEVDYRFDVARATGGVHIELY
jgi:hypothetical protein